MSAKITGANIPFGITEPLPLEGFPEGRKRFRFRSNDFVVLRIKTKDGIREFYPKECDGKWIPYIEKGRNKTI